MRHRLPSPVRPFDPVPGYVVEAAKRLLHSCRLRAQRPAAVPDSAAMVHIAVPRALP